MNALLWVLALVAVLAVKTTANDSLKLVHVFFRHGSRTPEEKDIFPNDPYKLEHFQPMGWGQLTNIGKQRAFKLGKLLRKRYDNFLGQIYIPDIVVAQSTDFDRTKMSALLALAGLFKPAPSQIWDDEVTWLPIPFKYDKENYDYTLRRPNSYCPTYFKELEDVYSSADTQLLLRENKKLFQFVTKNSGKEMKSMLDMFSIYQTLTAELSLNYTLPEWAKSVYEDIEILAGKQAQLENSNAVLKKLNGGRMLGKIIDQMVAKSKNELHPDVTKMYLYSGHENNVINILAALDLFDGKIPKYSAAVMVELHYLEKTKIYAVKVSYARDVNAEPEEQKLAGCDVLCPLSEFIRITDGHVPKNYTEECGSYIDLDS